MEELMSIKGTNGTIVAYDDRVVIKRKGFIAYAYQGFKGDTTYYYKNLSGVEYKKPGILSGYMRFIIAGTVVPPIKVHLFNSPNQNINNENTVLLGSNHNVPKLSQELYNMVMNRITNSDNKLHCESEADEIKKFKQLLDDGAITKEEYDEKKKQLLNI